MTKQTSNALLILFPGFNTLDVNGPLEVFRKSGSSEIFKVTIASETDITESVEGALMKRHIPLDLSLINNLDIYDLLIVPGGRAKDSTSPVQIQANTPNSAFMNLIHTFHSLPPSPAQPPRILLSICTGAIFLGKLGIFNDIYCTTHHGAYGTLVQYNDAAAAASGGKKAGKVLPARYVDAGIYDGRVRIISSGGISCGIDASLHIVSLSPRGGEKEAIETAVILDYAWRETDGVSFDAKFPPPEN